MTEMLQCHPVLALHKKKNCTGSDLFGNTQDVYKNIYTRRWRDGRRLIRKSYL